MSLGIMLVVSVAFFSFSFLAFFISEDIAEQRRAETGIEDEGLIRCEIFIFGLVISSFFMLACAYSAYFAAH